EILHEIEVNNAKASASKMKFLLEKTEVNKKRLEEEAIVRLKTEAKIRKIRNHLSDIIDSMPSMLICIDSNYQVTEWNKAVSNFMNIKDSDAKGKPLQDVFPIVSEKMDIIKDTVNSRVTHTIEKFEYIKKEQVIFFDILMYPLVTESDLGAVIRLDDVTTHVRMENIMVQTEKMMSVGGLAAGMAHEINNPLGGILQG